MSVRPLTAEEREYLGLMKASLDGALQGVLITAGIVALPLGFLATSWRSQQDAVALVLATLILTALTAAILNYTVKSSRNKGLRRGDLALRGKLAEDLIARAATSVSGTVEGKIDATAKLPWQRRAPRGAPRRFFLTVAGRDFEVSGARWLSTAIGTPMTVEFAERSGVVLAIDGYRERMPLAVAEPEPV